MTETLEETLRRLKKERDEADRRYNDALTALDQATMRAPESLPHPPPVYDEHQITPLNKAWNVIAAPSAASGLKGRLAAFVWGIVAPSLQKQQAFNSLLVDHVNRNVGAHREAQRAIETTIAMMRQTTEQLLAFQARLIQYLQQITLYVDTRDRATAGQDLVVNAAVNALGDNFAKRWESMTVREQHWETREQHRDARAAAIAAAYDDLRTLITMTQQASLATKREVERLVSTPNSQLPKATDPAATTSATDAFQQSLDAYKYVGFEDQFRGSQETIRARLEGYVPMFEGASDVLDVGCGRGEFLDLLQRNGISARGIDLNPEMVEVCRARGLDVSHADAVSYLEAQPDESLGGLLAAQVVEHLKPAYLVRFLELAHQKLRPGSTIVLETLNPACWVAFFDSFIRDITHVWPLHPDTLRYLVLASGFTSASIEFRSPVEPKHKLQPIAVAADSPLADVAETFNANVEKLNARLFTYLDYAIVGRRS